MRGVTQLICELCKMAMMCSFRAYLYWVLQHQLVISLHSQQVWLWLWAGSPCSWGVWVREPYTEKMKELSNKEIKTGTKTNWPTDHRSQCNLKLNLCHCTTNYRPSSQRGCPNMKNKESNCHSNKCSKHLVTCSKRGKTPRWQTADGSQD
jgi:hypothetical protein